MASTNDEEQFLLNEHVKLFSSAGKFLKEEDSVPSHLLPLVVDAVFEQSVKLEHQRHELKRKRLNQSSDTTSTTTAVAAPAPAAPAPTTTSTTTTTATKSTPTAEGKTDPIEETSVSVPVGKATDDFDIDVEYDKLLIVKVVDVKDDQGKPTGKKRWAPLTGATRLKVEKNKNNRYRLVSRVDSTGLVVLNIYTDTKCGNLFRQHVKNKKGEMWKVVMVGRNHVAADKGLGTFAFQTPSEQVANEIFEKLKAAGVPEQTKKRTREG